MTNPVCAQCSGPLENAHLCDPAFDWISTACDAAEYAAALAAPTCPCGKPKEAGDLICDACAKAEEAKAGRDYEEEERVERLLKILPEGESLTATELAEYLS